MEDGEVTMEQEKREGFGSRLGFLMVSAGCAIGIGNVWKFPYVAGQNGGAIFVLFYLLFLVLMGIPVLAMELSIGRASGKTIVAGYKALERKGGKWHLHGWLCLAGCFLLMMYYTTVSGWMLAYFLKYLFGDFRDVPATQVALVFNNLLENPAEMGIYTALIIGVGFAVISLGVKKGLERVNKIMMLGLLGLILVLAVNSLTLENSGEGLRFFLRPNMETVREVGIFRVVTAAMNQAFFTLSIGIAAMEIFGSYMSKKYTIAGESVKICALDTFVALIAGLIIFPACFSFGIEPTEGPSLIFVTLPRVFAEMPGGRIWGMLFFLFMTFASFSTVTGVFENLVASGMDNHGWTRLRSVLINAVLMLAASAPCVLGYNVLSEVALIGKRDIMSSEDFIVSNLLLPIGALVIIMFCMSKRGFGPKRFFAEVNTGEGLRMSEKLRWYFTLILPGLILVILVLGLIM